MAIIIYALLSVKEDSDKLDLLLKGMPGLLNAEINSLQVGQISAIVSNISRTDLITDSTNALLFARIIDSLSHKFSLLPMRFGSMMESSGVILQMLERNYIAIQKNLGQIEDKFEYGLKVFCDSAKLKADLVEKTKFTTLPTEQSTTESKPSVYREWVNKKLEEHRLEEMFLTHVDKVIASITEQISGMNAVSKFRKMLTETTIIDALFLLRKDQNAELMEVITNLKKQHEGLNFVMTGPWPPYNFVEITIK
ncbi:MAG: GvpL/GvpF family gas vesicle protein [Prolixibacteraceae bacterium]